MGSKRIAIALASTLGMLSIGMSRSSADTPVEEPALETRSERLTILEGAGAAIPEAISKRRQGEPQGEPGRVPWTVCRLSKFPPCSLGPRSSNGIEREGDGILDARVRGRVPLTLWKRDR